MKKMKQDLVTYLPPEIITEILARLPPKTILRWKCVCKSWYHLLETREFAKYHISKSIPGLALCVKTEKNIQHTNMLLDIQHDNLHLNTIIKLYSSHDIQIHGSVDGLLLLQIFKTKFQLHLCNPITREYIDLHHSHSHQFDPSKPRPVNYGFGVSKVRGQYKAVAIFHDQSPPWVILPKPECKVYTIGTGSWRSVAPDVRVRYNVCHSGAFVNGNLHWLAHDLNHTLCVSCFDLETELFTTFSLPPSPRNEKTSTGVFLVAVEGTLCVCDYTSNYASMVTIWLMKEYGVEKSWKKELVIGKCRDIWRILAIPIKISKDGVIFMTPYQKNLFYYSREDKTTQRICNSGEFVYITSLPHVPTFLSLKCFTKENLFSL